MPLREEERVELDAKKRKDLYQCSRALPEIPLIGRPGEEIEDEYGDVIVPENPALGPTCRDLYPWDGSEEEGSSSEDEGDDA